MNIKSNSYFFKDFALIIVMLLLLVGCALALIQKEDLCYNNLGSPIHNFCEVKPNILWRGSKPDKDDAAWLINNGVKTIVNLELLHDDIDTIHQANITDTGIYKIDYFRVKTWEPLYAIAQSIADNDVIHFLAIASKANKPIYVHCRLGEYRTGIMVAAYEIIIDGQTSTNELAAVLGEMQRYKGVWSNFNLNYIKGLSLRREEIIQKVKAFTLAHPIQIICNNGKCESNKHYGD